VVSRKSQHRQESDRGDGYCGEPHREAVKCGSDGQREDGCEDREQPPGELQEGRFRCVVPEGSAERGEQERDPGGEDAEREDGERCVVAQIPGLKSETWGTRFLGSFAADEDREEGG